MATTPMDIPVTEQMLMVVPWLDPVVDSVGFDVRSQYVRALLAERARPDRDVDPSSPGARLRPLPVGVRARPRRDGQRARIVVHARHDQRIHALAESLRLFGVSQPTEGGLAVRRRVPPVATRHLMRMPPHLRQAHQQWSVPTTRISLADLERARVLAEAMVETGDEPDVVERQLLALGVTPAAAIEATSMAIGHGYSPDAA